jgi:CheY-like chemotaxis protein
LQHRRLPALQVQRVRTLADLGDVPRKRGDGSLQLLQLLRALSHDVVEVRNVALQLGVAALQRALEALPLLQHAALGLLHLPLQLLDVRRAGADALQHLRALRQLQQRYTCKQKQ